VNSAAAHEIAAGYATEGGALELGTVVVDGAVDPSARVRIPLAMLNRHGLVAGATGTGKTKTLQGVAEQLSAAGVPVLLADVKGDVSGMARPGASNDKIAARAADTGDDWMPTAFPVEFLSLGGESSAVPIRATITQFGPILLSKVLDLNSTQESTLGLIFHWADKRGLPLLDIKDLRAVIQHLTSDEGKADLKGIGGVSPTTAGVILRALVNLEAQGGEDFFGEPSSTVTASSRCWSWPTRPATRASTPRSSCGCSPSSSRTSPRPATSTSPSWCSSSTRPTCCSPTPRRRSWSVSSRP
jgi:hypothetical protein